jgi:predicted NAD/FAD-dependent oxidoreductase
MSESRYQPRIVVVGAGLAGLACAADLTAAGVPVQMLEAGKAAGQPAHRRRVSTSVLGPDRENLESSVRSRLATLYEADTTDWEHVATYTIPDALPAMPPPHPLSRPRRLSARHYACGDYRASGSIQGALASGARAAREVLVASR